MYTHVHTCTHMNREAHRHGRGSSLGAERRLHTQWDCVLWTVVCLWVRLLWAAKRSSVSRCLGVSVSTVRGSFGPAALAVAECGCPVIQTEGCDLRCARHLLSVRLSTIGLFLSLCWHRPDGRRCPWVHRVELRACGPHFQMKRASIHGVTVKGLVQPQRR